VCTAKYLKARQTHSMSQITEFSPTEFSYISVCISGFVKYIFKPVHTVVFIPHVYLQHCRLLGSNIIHLSNYTVSYPRVKLFNAMRLLIYRNSTIDFAGGLYFIKAYKFMVFIIIITSLFT
jgi:hypothetical protein